MAGSQVKKQGSVTIMSDILTFDEIKSRLPSEWVLVGEPEADVSLEPIAARVRCHSINREEVDRKLLEPRPARFAVRYQGEMQENTALVL
jgi:hypothetical protein